MPKQIGLFAPTAFLVALTVTIIAGSPASATAECAAAPGLQAPQGGHWYYRTDRATGRKCWYVSPDGRKGHGQAAPNLTAHTQPTEEPFAPPTSETVGDRSTPPTLVEQPTPLPWPVTAAGGMTQAATPSPQQTNPSEPEQPMRVSGEEARAPADAQVVDEQRERPAQRPVTTTPEMADLVALTPVSLLLLAVGILAVAGIFLRRIFEIAPARRPPLRQVQDDLAVVIAAARRAAPPLPPPYSPRDYAGAHARCDEEPNPSRAKPRQLFEDVEDALVGVLRHWEHPAASAN